jgi:hypothetical protein
MEHGRVTTYQFTIKGIEAPAATHVALVLPIIGQESKLRVRLAPLDAQALAGELAGIGSVRTRMAQTCCRLVAELDGVLEGVELQRGAGNLVEAQVRIRAGVSTLHLPVAFGDGIAIALANRLPVSGDDSLTPLIEENEQLPSMHESVEEDEAVVALPASFANFVNSLPDF